MQSPNPQHSDRQAQAREALDFQWLLAEEPGRRIVRTLLRWSGVEDTGPLGDVAAMAAHAGGRVVGALLRAKCRQHAPEGWVRLEADWTRELRDKADAEQRADEARRLAHAAPGEQP